MKEVENANRARFAEAIRHALVQAAIEAHDDAGVRGLCGEGRWEVAIGAMRQLDLRHILEQTGD